MSCANRYPKTAYLANALHSLGLSEKQLAQRLGLSLATIRCLERPEAPIYLRLAVAALVGGLDPDAILSRPAPTAPKRRFDEGLRGRKAAQNRDLPGAIHDGESRTATADAG